VEPRASLAAKRTNVSSGSGRPIRCAIYTRKSTTEGLDSEFSSLDAQREACEHYIRSQTYQGWQIVPTHYDDGGYSGGKLERPALQTLLREIDAGAVDMLVVYKYDRLSRSMMDFLKLLERLDQHGVGFVSVTQQIDTSSSTGRLLFNMLLSFSQFEREIGSERTRDKIQAARRRGQWTGGRLVLGYAQVPGRKGSLQVVPEEAKIVRLIFDLYLRTGSITAVAQRLNERGLRQVKKRKGGQASPGRSWDKNSVLRILRNDLYLGKVRSKDGTLYPAEHEALIPQDVFDRVAARLDKRTTGTLRRSREHEYLLTGLLHCGPATPR
jgi:site-specific DNA recombinase